MSHTINKGIVLKDTETGRYYTGEWQNPWSRDLRDAKRFALESWADNWIEQNPDDFEQMMVLQAITVRIITRND